MAGWVAVTVVLGGTVLAACGSSKTTSKGPVTTPQAHSFSGLRSVGPLFPPGSSVHTCTASVIASRTGDLVITAAHCVSGTGAGWRFAPGYDNGVEPYGSWNVVGLYGAPGWLHSTLASSDYAIVKVAPRVLHGKEQTLQDVVGANRLATAPANGATVTVPAYALGSNDRPVTCTVRVRYQGIYPAFTCNPYVGGTSGAPWLEHTRSATTVVGVIGGLHQGGCTPETSYSAPFDATTLAIATRAAKGATPSQFPPAPSDGCSS
jgi:V8-like Glu-specific endopeptidase